MDGHDDYLRQLNFNSEICTNYDSNRKENQFFTLELTTVLKGRNIRNELLKFYEQDDIIVRSKIDGVEIDDADVTISQLR